MRTLRVDGHHVAVVESMDEDGVSFLLCVDDAAITDAARSDVPNTADVCAAMLRWSQHG